MTEDKKQLVFEPPSKETPGYLKRQRKAIEFMAKLQGLASNPDPDVVDEMVEFLLPWITVPEDRDEARDMLWNASEQDFWDLFNAVQGGAAKNSPETPSTESS